MTNALHQLAEWVANVSAEDFPDQWDKAKEWTLISLVDTIGCTIGGRDHPATKASYNTVAGWSKGNVSVVGQADGLAAPWAAFVNGTAGHALDFNGWDPPTASNSLPVMLAALLAIAEAENKTGAEVIDAYIVGMEATLRVGEAANLAHYHLGWHTTSTMAAIGAAAGCARLLGLDAAQTAHAISIATSQAGGYKSQFGTPMKLLHSGMGAKTGVLSAYMAQNGITASPDALDGQWSFLSLQAGETAPGFDAPMKKLGKVLALAEYGIVIKPYPSCAYTHRAIDGVRDLQAEHGFSAETVQSITARIPYYNAGILTYPDPVDDTQARFSMQYCLAVAMRNGTVLPADFENDAIFDPATRALLDKTTLEAHALDAESSDISIQKPAIVTVTLTDGSQLMIEVDYARGMPQRMYSSAELEAKFTSLAANKIGAAACADLLVQLWNFEQVEDVATVLQAFKFAN